MDDELSTDAQRLDALGAKLRDAEQRHAPTASQDGVESNGSGMALALKYTSEFAGAVIVTGVIGYVIDRVAGTSPWGLLVGIMLGTVAGFYALVRSAQKSN